MIILDTNLISELWKVDPNPGVLDWIDAQAVETLYRRMAHSAFAALWLLAG